MNLDSAGWGERYRAADTPWDLGGAHPELLARLAEELAVPKDARAGRRALVAGCGRGHDALALSDAGWRVIAVDFVDPSGGELDRRLRERGGEFRRADALSLDVDAPFDLIFEHTFFCAIDPARRADWGSSMRRALAVGGRLAALVFPVDKPEAEGGPPFGVSVAQIQAALGADFELAVDEAARRTVSRRTWPERWAVWRRAR